MVSRETYRPQHYFDLNGVWFSTFFLEVDQVWGLLAPDRKESWIRGNFSSSTKKLRREGSLVLETYTNKFTVEAGSYVVGDEIELISGALIEAGAWVTGPTILGEGTIVRHGAYIRGGVITGKNALIGHASEVKSSIFLNNAKAPHFAYVGDSIVGNSVNLGAGTKVSNLKITHDEVILRIGDENIPSGLRKFGAIIGDNCETGCNSVLNPGVLLGKGCLVYPAVAVQKNYYKPKSVIR